MSDRKALARCHCSAIKTPLHRVPFTEEELTAIRGGRTAEEYRWHLIRTYLADIK
jgi:hypothetical protein